MIVEIFALNKMNFEILILTKKVSLEKIVINNVPY